MKLDLTALLPDAAKPYAKYVYAVLTLAATLVALGVFDGKTAEVITAIVGLVLVPGSVYQAENRPADGVNEVVAQDVHPADVDEESLDHDSDFDQVVAPQE